MSDYKGASLIFGALPPAKALIADRGYDSASFRQALAAEGIEPCIPSSRSRKIPYAYDKALHRQRHKGENLLAKLKDWRRIATRYDRCDTSPVLEAAEHDLDTVPLVVEDGLVGDRHFSAAGMQEVVPRSSREQGVVKAAAVIATAGDEFAGRRKMREQESRATVVAGLPLGQERGDGPTLSIADGVKLGIQPTFGTADTAGTAPF